MDEALIKNHNEVVRDGDTVFHDGDFGFGTPQELMRIRRRLNGQIFLIRGNHDKQFEQGMFGWVKDYYELNIDNTKVILCHYPMLTWNKEHYGSIMLSGHTHDPLKLVRPGYKGIHIGVDAWNFRPINWDEIKAFAETINVSKDFRGRNNV